eukprot:77148-Rhodomonas_salina.2
MTWRLHLVVRRNKCARKRFYSIGTFSNARVLRASATTMGSAIAIAAPAKGPVLNSESCCPTMLRFEKEKDTSSTVTRRAAEESSERHRSRTCFMAAGSLLARCKRAMECTSALRAFSFDKLDEEKAKDKDEDAGAEDDRVAEACWRSLESEEWGV